MSNNGPIGRCCGGVAYAGTGHAPDRLPPRPFSPCVSAWQIPARNVCSLNSACQIPAKNVRRLISACQIPAKNTARSTKKWLSDKVCLLDWPSSSPDLSPIENLWGSIKQNVIKSWQQTKAALQAKLREIWSHVTPRECSQLLASLPSSKGRCHQVLSDMGDYFWEQQHNGRLLLNWQ